MNLGVLLGYLGGGAGVTFKIVGIALTIWLKLKKCSFAISMLLSNGFAMIAGPGIQVGATCGQKLYHRTTWATFGRLGNDRVRGALLELWERLGNGRKPAQKQVRPEVEVYLSDKSCD